ncbi:MAG: signal peptide peptidase SppA [Kiritimatiellae bacterium]|nr:signal peptide peptidase SppA [Kiritimatiellia bacterium]
MSDNMKEKKSSRGCGFGCLVMLAVIGAFFAAFAALVYFGLASTSFEGVEIVRSLQSKKERGLGDDESPRMTESWSTGSGNTRVVRIPVTGMIMLTPTPWGDRNTVTALRSIRKATHDETVKALILEVNSGGGGITASDVIYQALLNFKAAQPDRKIVVIMGDMAASGAYYVSLPADYILAHPTTVTGSIGVIMQSVNIQELAAKIGITDVTVKSGENKDFFNPMREVNPEQVAMMQRLIARMHQRFVSLIVENRKLPQAAVEKLADGRVYLADEAVQNGLIDGIGYYQDAEKKIAELLEVESVKVLRYHEQMTLSDFFGGGGAGIASKLEALIQGQYNGSGLMYLSK